MMDNNIIRALEEKNLKVFQFLMENGYNHEKDFDSIFKICVADVEYLEYFEIFMNKLKEIDKHTSIHAKIGTAFLENNIIDKRFVDQLEWVLVRNYAILDFNKILVKLFDNFFDNFDSIYKSITFHCGFFSHNYALQIKTLYQFKYVMKKGYSNASAISEFYKNYLLGVMTIDDFVLEHLLNYQCLTEILFHLLHHNKKVMMVIFLVNKKDERVYVNKENPVHEYMWKIENGIRYTLYQEFEKFSESSDFHKMIDIHLELDKEYNTSSISNFIYLGCRNKNYNLLRYIQSKKDITDQIIRFTEEENIVDIFSNLNIEVTDKLLLKKKSLVLLKVYNNQKEAQLRKSMRRFYGIKLHRDQFNQQFNYIKERGIKHQFKNIELCTEEEKIPVLVALSFSTKLSHFIGEDRMRIIVKGDDVYYGFYTSDETPFLHFEQHPSRFYDV